VTLSPEAVLSAVASVEDAVLAGVESVVEAELPPQAARLRAMVPASPRAANLCILRILISPPKKKSLLAGRLSAEGLSLSLSLSYTRCPPKAMVYFWLLLQYLRQFRKGDRQNM